MIEIWKDISGYENNYAVSNMGFVKNLFSGKILRSEAPSADYNRIGLFDNGIPKFFAVHRLVAIHFVANPENKPVVHHIDEDKWNNIFTNLKWATHKENSNYHYEYVRKKIAEFKIGLSVNVIGTNHISKIIDIQGNYICLEAAPTQGGFTYIHFEKLSIK
jgi:NUMOD4 motif-containing protein/HNH endonuclease